jgi:phage terminase small subunit
MARTGKFLTKRMIAFVEAVAAQPIGAVNGTKAAKQAGYSEKSAKVAASEMLRDFRIIEAVKMARAGQLQECRFIPRATTAAKPKPVRAAKPAPTADPAEQPAAATAAPEHGPDWPFPPPGGPVPETQQSQETVTPEQVEDFLTRAPKTFTDSMDILLRIANHPELDIEVRKDAAKSLLPYQHAKKEGSKKAEAEAKSKTAANKFTGTPPPPRLAVNNG